MAKLLILGQGRELDIKGILEYETCAIPLVIFTRNGNMRKSTKSQLAKELESTMSGDNTHDYNNHGRSLVVDGMSLVETVEGSGNIGQYAAKLLACISQEGKGFTRTDVVFDVYHLHSVKSTEKQRHGKQKMCDIKIADEVCIPPNWVAFLSNINNKNNLVFVINT